MAEVNLSTGIEYFADPNRGRPVYNGNIYVGIPDLNPKIELNRVSVILLQENGTKVTLAPSAQPFKTGAGGQILYNGSPAVIRVSDTVSVRVDDSAGNQVNYNPRYNENTSISATINEGVAPVNGSFESADASNIPENWVLSTVSGTIISDTVDSSHGLRALKITSIDSTGGGSATSAKFNVQMNEVLEPATVDVRFSYKSTGVNVLNEVRVQYYNAAGTLLSIDTIYSEGAVNPVGFTSIIRSSDIPASAVQADVVLDGVMAAGTVKTGSTWFDGVSVSFISGLSLVGVDGSVIKLSDVPNAVNEITATNSASGNPVKQDASGADTDVGYDISSKGAGDVTITSPAGNINLVTPSGQVLLNGQSTEKRSALVYQLSANQSIPDDSVNFTVLIFDNVSHDNGGIYNGANNTRLTVPVNVSRIRLNYAVHIDPSGTGYRRTLMMKNGDNSYASFAGAAKQTLGNPSTTIQESISGSSGVLSVVPGDYFEVAIQQTSGGPLNIVNGDSSTWFSMEIVG